MLSFSLFFDIVYSSHESRKQVILFQLFNSNYNCVAAGGTVLAPLKNISKAMVKHREGKFQSGKNP